MVGLYSIQKLNFDDTETEFCLKLSSAIQSVIAYLVLLANIKLVKTSN